MTLSAAATLLQTALLLLTTAMSSPNLSASFSQHAVDVANQAITAAQSAVNSPTSPQPTQNSQVAAASAPTENDNTVPTITDTNVDATYTQQTTSWTTNIPTISTINVSDSQGVNMFNDSQPPYTETSHSAQFHLLPGTYTYAIYPTQDAGATRKTGTFTVTKSAPVVPTSNVFDTSGNSVSVIYTEPGCDYFITSDGVWDQLLEWYSGNLPSVGDTYYGDLSGYGFKDIYGPTGSMHIWEEDYLLSSSEAASQYADKCGTATLSNDNYYTNTYGQSVHSPAYSTNGIAPAEHPRNVLMAHTVLV